MDLISRQAAIDALCHVDEYNSRSVEAIKQLPSAHPRKGKWINIDDKYNRISGRCSECGWEAHMYEDDVVGMDYCPNCGSYNGGEE